MYPAAGCQKDVTSPTDRITEEFHKYRHFSFATPAAAVRDEKRENSLPPNWRKRGGGRKRRLPNMIPPTCTHVASDARMVNFSGFCCLVFAAVTIVLGSAEQHPLRILAGRLRMCCDGLEAVPEIEFCQEFVVDIREDSCPQFFWFYKCQK